MKRCISIFFLLLFSTLAQAREYSETLILTATQLDHMPIRAIKESMLDIDSNPAVEQVVTFTNRTGASPIKVDIKLNQFQRGGAFAVFPLVDSMPEGARSVLLEPITACANPVEAKTGPVGDSLGHGWVQVERHGTSYLDLMDEAYVHLTITVQYSIEIGSEVGGFTLASAVYGPCRDLAVRGLYVPLGERMVDLHFGSEAGDTEFREGEAGFEPTRSTTTGASGVGTNSNLTQDNGVGGNALFAQGSGCQLGGPVSAAPAVSVMWALALGLTTLWRAKKKI